ncbi:MAG: hypothetical protein KIS92_22825 [Planctomycetota bacterium]|nr:hypothetical protein [Planctomycetota bacterium]
MDESSSPQAAANQRIPFSLAYLLAVVLGAAMNAVVFALLVRKLLAPQLESGTLFAITAFFGIVFAGGCNVSAQSLARWFNRRSAVDRILFFAVVTLLGDVALVLIVPLVVAPFQ